MNKLLLLLATLALWSSPCTAQSNHRRNYDQERATPRVDSVGLHAAALTDYLTDMLRLQARQQPAVRRCVRQHLEQLDSLHWRAAVVGPIRLGVRDELARRYTANLQRVLTPAQCRNLQLLPEYAPAPEPPTTWLATYR